MPSVLPDNLDTNPRCTIVESTLSGTRAFVLDNGIFRLSVLPEFGGRICSLFYRPVNYELLSTEFLHGPRKSFNVHGGWCAAFPSLLGDGEVLSQLPWTAEISENTEQAVSLRLGCYVERVSHKLEGVVRVTPGTILVERIIRVTAGEAALEVEEQITNRNSWPIPTVWSAVVTLRAQAGDRAVFPVKSLEVQRGVGPTGNELDFGLLVTTPFQAFARDLQDGWVGFRPAAAPIDVRILFPREILPHAVIAAQRNETHSAEGLFRFQPLTNSSPIADDTRGGALILPPKQTIRIPLRLEAGAGVVSAGEWSRPGLQLAELIVEQHVPTGRAALWRVGKHAFAIKTPHVLILLMPEFEEDGLITPEDLPAADLIVCATAPPRATLQRLVQRTAARFIGPASLRQMLRTDGVGEERSITLSPGARIDFPGLGILATPSRTDDMEERLGYLLQIDHLLLYHAGCTEFLGEFGTIGQQFHPQLVLLPLQESLSMADSIQTIKLLQARLVVPLGDEVAEHEFMRRCREQHVSFGVQTLSSAEGRLFDGWHLAPLE